MGSTATDVAIITLVILALSLPFVSKPFHIDDGIYIEMAQETHNLNPFDTRGRYLYGGVEFDNLALNAHPIVIPYILKGLMALAGGASEVPLHLGFLLFSLAAGISAYFLARRFTHSPLLCALLVITAPAFVVSGHSLMSDVPQMAMWLTATVLCISGLDRHKSGRLVAAGFVAGLGSLTGYQTLAIVPLCLLYGVLIHGWSGLLKSAIAMAIPCAIFGLWCAGSHAEQGLIPIIYAGEVAERFPDSYAGVEATLGQFMAKLLSLLSNLGGVGIFPLVILAAFLANRRTKWSLFAGGMVSFLFVGSFASSYDSEFLLKVGEYNTGQRLFLWFCVAIGAAILWRAVIGGVGLLFRLGRTDAREKETLFLFVWILGVAVYHCYILPFGAARYLLPMLLPVAAVLTRQFEPPLRDRTGWFRPVATVSILCSAILSAAIALGDYEQAQVYRDFADSSWLADRIEAAPGGWHMNTELGARIYLGELHRGKDGLAYLTDRTLSADKTSPKPVLPAVGDHFIRCVETWSPTLHRIWSRPTGKKLVVSRVNWPVRTYSKHARVGFYTHTNGYLPFWIDRESPLETFGIYVVERVMKENMDDAPQESPRHVFKQKKEL